MHLMCWLKYTALMSYKCVGTGGTTLTQAMHARDTHWSWVHMEKSPKVCSSLGWHMCLCIYIYICLSHFKIHNIII